MPSAALRWLSVPGKAGGLTSSDDTKSGFTLHPRFGNQVKCRSLLTYKVCDQGFMEHVSEAPRQRQCDAG